MRPEDALAALATSSVDVSKLTEPNKGSTDTTSRDDLTPRERAYKEPHIRDA